MKTLNRRTRRRVTILARRMVKYLKARKGTVEGSELILRSWGMRETPEERGLAVALLNRTLAAARAQ